MNECKHESIIYDDFISYETDDKGRCTKYVSYSHCSNCNRKFRKFFKLIAGELKARTYVLEKEEHE
jgi:hypothetical protein